MRECDLYRHLSGGDGWGRALASVGVDGRGTVLRRRVALRRKSQYFMTRDFTYMLSNHNIANIPAISYVVAVAHDTTTGSMLIE